MAMRVATTTILTGPRRAPLPSRSDALVTPVPTPLGIPGLTIAGTMVHLTDAAGARDAIARAVRARILPPLAVASINLDHIHHLRQHPAAGGGRARWLNLIDGAPIARQATRMTGAPWPRLAGSDLIIEILDDADAHAWSVAVLGGAPEVHDPLVARLAAGWPSVRLVGHWTPTREELSAHERSLALAEEIRRAGADIVIVCLGKPRQEEWIDEYGGATGAGVLLAFGAVVDFLAGRVSRAPRWVSTAGLEWMWRLMLEPRRLAKRYLIEGPPAYVAVRRSSTPSRA
jgi:N-acetylglucosaminyldiphosphoundecaprenol N-acetyl-beta-D-mannosaminyltransferase